MHFEQNSSHKTGLPPGTPIYIGDTPPQNTTVSLLTYTKEGCSGFIPVTGDDQPEKIPEGTNAWLNISGLHDANLILEVLSKYSIHPLVIEDILNTRTRSKIEEFDNYLFIVLNKLHNREEGVSEEQVSLILLEHILITCTESSDLFSNIEERISRTNGRLRLNDADYLMYSIIDTIVDGYFIVLEGLEERIEFLEDTVVNNPDNDTVSHVQSFRHDLVWFRRKIWSLRELITRLERTDSFLIHRSTHLYLRDVYDHTIKIAEDVDVYREMAEGLLEIYLSKISNNTNEIMKVLTIIA
ncbi:MAG TPA: magnesium and cobalt transport protein CorA, partial [Methanospirillum sp.]|nr:magnesium and cobalt transport protein CorA [Methanospirillum sp.]